MTWEQPHWSGRPQQGAGPRQKLRPNLFARLARFAVSRNWLLLALWVAVALACAAYAASHIEINPDQRPRVTLDETTARLQAELDRQFPGIEQTFLALVESRDPATARQQALALSTSLSDRKDLFLSAFVPGTGEFYARNALLFQDLEAVRARVDLLIQMEPLHYALAASPDIIGFAALVNEIGKAVEQGRSPPGLEAMLLAAASAIEAQVKGAPRPVSWAALAGLDGTVRSQNWYVLATPRPGLEWQAAEAARRASEGMQGVEWLWPRRALQANPSAVRDFVVPAGLSVVLTLVLSAAVLGSLRQALALLLSGAVTLSVAGGAAVAMGRPLDGVTWSFALAVLAPVFSAGGVLCVAYGGGRAKGLSALQSVMLAAHRHGGLVTGSVLIFAVMWLAWLPRQLPSLSQFAVIGLIGCALAWAVAMTLLPAALSVFAAANPEDEQNWLDEAMEAKSSPRLHNMLDVLAVILLAAAGFSAVFLPGVRFGERQLPSDPPPLLETLDARGAVHVLVPADRVSDTVTTLGSLAEVGAIRTAGQFLPPDVADKIAELRRLSALSPFEPAFKPPPPDFASRQSFADLKEQLSAIAQSPAASPQLKEAALRLRRAVELLIMPEPPTGEALTELERALFGGLSQLSVLVGQLAQLEPPQVKDLDPRLLRRFVAEDGTWRIEVMPRSGTGELSFAASLRRAVPEAAGEPLVSLARNEIVHRQSLLALATALVGLAVLVFLTLRDLRAWALSLVPAGAFLTITAAVTVTLGIGLTAVMLASISAALAVLVASAMRVAFHLSDAGQHAGGEGLARRAASLPPVALAGAVAPLALSSRPAVAELGISLGLLLLVVALLSLILVPALDRWTGALARRRPRAG